jgi:hypothetical protein
MRRAIDETERRRAKQVAFNEEHGITPQTIMKRVADVMEGGGCSRSSRPRCSSTPCSSTQIRAEKASGVRGGAPRAARPPRPRRSRMVDRLVELELTDDVLGRRGLDEYVGVRTVVIGADGDQAPLGQTTVAEQIHQGVEALLRIAVQTGAESGRQGGAFAARQTVHPVAKARLLEHRHHGRSRHDADDVVEHLTLAPEARRRQPLGGQLRETADVVALSHDLLQLVVVEPAGVAQQKQRFGFAQAVQIHDRLPISQARHSSVFR